MRLPLHWTKWPFSRYFYSAVVSGLALMGFCFCTIADVSHVIKYAPNPSYDNIPITPKTWEEVDLIYYSTISGHRYTNTIQLLRPIMWLHKRHMDIIGSKVTLSMPEFGIVNVMTTVKAIKPTRVNSRGFNWSKRNREYVIGRFMRSVTDVRTYTFKDSLGHISHIIATPNHPFYVKNKHAFVSIGNVSDDDTLCGAIGSGGNHIDGSVHLVCAKGKHSHCGVAFWVSGLPIPVYNLEVYRRHIYLISTQNIMVHNICTPSEIAIKRVEESKFMESYPNMDIYFSREFGGDCPISKAKDLHHKKSSLLIITLDPNNSGRFLIEGFYDEEAIKTQIRRKTESLWAYFNTPGRYSDDERHFVELGVAELASGWKVPISQNNHTTLTKMSLLASYDVFRLFDGPLQSSLSGRPIEVFIGGNNATSKAIDLAREKIYHVSLRP